MKSASQNLLRISRLVFGAFVLAVLQYALAMAADKPNIIVIMGDDIGMWNIGAYSRGLMYKTTPNIDKLACRRRDLKRLLRRGELHGGPGQLYYR